MLWIEESFVKMKCSVVSLIILKLMKDLVAIFKILNVCADRVGDNPVYIEPMLDLLTLCRFPFLKEKSSDETSFEQIAAKSVSQLGEIISIYGCKNNMCYRYQLRYLTLMVIHRSISLFLRHEL